jgi:sphinganine-1-phosphate aldolase
MTMHPYAGRYPVNVRLPERGVPRADLIDEVHTMAHEEDIKAHEGRISGSIYSGDVDHYAFCSEIYGAFGHANVMQRDVYPSATKFEAEIIAMTADLLHGDATDSGDVGGVITSGGTESLMNPLYAYREWARETKGITEPEVIMPVTAHAALDKGAHYFGIKLIHAPLTDDFTVDVDFVRDHITANTIALVGTAGTYPHGLIDPIAELGELAQQHGLGLHVDGCLGGFILCWAEACGVDIPRFDLRVPGVTSISADTHKYGYALKGSSVLLYRPKHLRHYQYFMKFGWPGGLYSSPGMSGSRSGGIIAQTWAAMVSIGREGYVAIAKDIFATGAKIAAAVRSHPELQLMGRPTFNVAFRSDVVDIFHVNDHLTAKGWRMNGLQLPPGLHFCVTRPNTQPGVAEAFAVDLAEAVAYAKAQPAGSRPRSGAFYGAGGVTVSVADLKPQLTARLDAMHSPGPLG